MRMLGGIERPGAAIVDGPAVRILPLFLIPVYRLTLPRLLASRTFSQTACRATLLFCRRIRCSG